jgi:hypothetical protein
MSVNFLFKPYIKTLCDNGLYKISAQIEPACFPCLFTSSPTFEWNFIFRPTTIQPPEFVYVPVPNNRDFERLSEDDKAVYQWESEMEGDHLQSDLLSGRLPPKFAWMSKFAGSNVYLLPGSQPKYEAYSPLYHLLPHSSIERFSLPLFLSGKWPVSPAYDYILRSWLPADFEDRLSQAFAHHIWPLLFQRSPLSDLSKNDPIVILSHNLDFWLPYAYQVIEERLRRYLNCDFETIARVNTPLRLHFEMLPYVDRDIVLQEGVDIWAGEVEAWKATRELVDAADRQGKLSTLIDSVKSHRVVDDFSDRWSHEREDFERKLYHKRSKIKVAFVEMDDTIPVHGPDSEVEENLLWEDFISLLNPKERQIVVCLRSGTTKLGDIGRKLGYANHSPVSKALKKIRAKAQQYLEN